MAIVHLSKAEVRLLARFWPATDFQEPPDLTTEVKVATVWYDLVDRKVIIPTEGAYSINYAMLTARQIARVVMAQRAGATR